MVVVVVMVVVRVVVMVVVMVMVVHWKLSKRVIITLFVVSH